MLVSGDIVRDRETGITGKVVMQTTRNGFELWVKINWENGSVEWRRDNDELEML